ncbi:MAG: hypothetical protein MUE41_16025 [Gemmatimonadaceae bacterium]|jgi:hypothetical protein|nr:hypothetical protein [Gemmatimonadaceae bacterium]
MHWTLWRGETQLGELIRRTEPGRQSGRLRRPSFSAFLIPASDSIVLSGVRQIVWPLEVRVGVQQHATEPVYVGASALPPTRRECAPRYGPVPLQLSPEARAGVPPEEQLTVRTRDGTSYLPALLHVMECRYNPEANDVEIEEAPPAARRDGIVWLVFMSFRNEAAAPAT